MAIMPALETHIMRKHTAGDATSVEVPTYEPPVLRLVGNLRDLLAGNGTKFSDDTINCSTADSNTLNCP